MRLWCQHGMAFCRHSACLLAPRLQLVLAPVRQVVHVCEQLIPGHHTWGGIRRHEAWACRTLRVCTNLLAHVLTEACELILQLCAVLQVLRCAGLLVLGVLHVEHGRGRHHEEEDDCTPHGCLTLWGWDHYNILS